MVCSSSVKTYPGESVELSCIRLPMVFIENLKERVQSWKKNEHAPKSILSVTDTVLVF